MFDAQDVLAAGMSAMRLRVNTIASNIANAETTRTPDGGPYKRKDVVMSATATPSPFQSALDEMTLSKPGVAAVIEDQQEARKVFQPGHPDADKEGYVAYPNINVVQSMTDLMTATRLYQANVSASRSVMEMSREARKISSSF
jgi:flagellar basal-body rod protein FlgC